jgi:hypothetical protein
MSGKCSICESEHRGWIEEQHEAGKSTREISKELEEGFGISISHVAIANHLKYHIGKEDRIIAELEKRIRNLEMWLAGDVSGGTFIGWQEDTPHSSETHSISRHSAYMTTIPHPETLQEEENAIKRAMMEKQNKEKEERLKRQREESARVNDIKAKEKRELEEMKRKGKEREEEARVQKMREEVEKYDSIH